MARQLVIDRLQGATRQGAVSVKVVTEELFAMFGARDDDGFRKVYDAYVGWQVMCGESAEGTRKYLDTTICNIGDRLIECDGDFDKAFELSLSKNAVGLFRQYCRDVTCYKAKNP